MTVEVITHRGGRAVIKCGFCQGKGLDPFGVLSELSLCQVCVGRQSVTMGEPLKNCSFCRGTGVHPHTRLTCTACMGRGAVTIRKPTATCPQCQGSGAVRFLDLWCFVCKGSGVVTVEGKKSKKSDFLATKPRSHKDRKNLVA